MSKSTEKMVAKKSHRVAAPPPAESVVIEEEQVDPSRMEYSDWLAGVDEWEKEGHDYEREQIPLERSQWDARMRRRAARLERERAAAEEKLRLERREATIKSLKPPPCGIVPDAKSVSDAEAALSETKLKFFDAWNGKFYRLPENVKQAWTIYHDDIGGDEYPEFYLRPRTPSADDFPADLTEIRSGLANPEYEKFQRYSMAVFQQIESLECES